MHAYAQNLVAAIAAVLVASSALAQAPQSAGEVMKVDRPGARVTLKHDGIRSLDMPAMTMIFRVRDGVAVGDRVRFSAEKIDGNYTVTALVRAS